MKLEVKRSIVKSTSNRQTKGACPMWLVTIFEEESYKIFEYNSHVEAKETFERYAKKARLSYVA